MEFAGLFLSEKDLETSTLDSRISRLLGICCISRFLGLSTRCVYIPIILVMVGFYNCCSVSIHSRSAYVLRHVPSIEGSFLFGIFSLFRRPQSCCRQHKVVMWFFPHFESSPASPILIVPNDASQRLPLSTVHWYVHELGVVQAAATVRLLLAILANKKCPSLVLYKYLQYLAVERNQNTSQLSSDLSNSF